MKRGKQIQDMINLSNQYFKMNRVKDLGNDVFMIVTTSLTNQNLYKGFRWMKYSGEVIDGVRLIVPSNGTENGCWLEIL